MNSRYTNRKLIPINLCFLIIVLLFGSIIVNADENITREEAVYAIEQAEQDMQIMIYENFSVVYINDTIIAANLALERADFAEILRENTTGELAEAAKKALEGLNWQGFTYDEVIEYTDGIAFRKNWAYNLSDSIRALELKILDYEQQGIDTLEAWVLLNKSATEFREERYENAENFLSEAHSNLEAKKAKITGIMIITEVGKNFLEKYWIELIIIFIIAGIAGYILWIKNKQRRTNKKIKELQIEKKVLEDLMKKAQIDRFEKGKIPESIYNIKMDKYKERLSRIEEILPVLKTNTKKKI